MKGKFIVIYGANNLGKSTQAKLLVKAMNQSGIKTQYLKYPIYELKPTGPKINSVLREGEKVPEKDLQELFVKNRKDFEPKLKKILSSGVMVVAEDYTGTGIAWGVVGGMSLKVLEELNKDLVKEDLGILISGKRFESGIEKENRNEISDKIWGEANQTHLKLGKKYGWVRVDANQTKEKLHRQIIKIVEDFLNGCDCECECC